MPEPRDGRKAALTDLSGGGGFFIRRVASPGALAVRAAGKPLPRRFMSPSSNKENVPPVWAVRVTRPKASSPLPDWYLRTPLPDITAIAKVLVHKHNFVSCPQSSDMAHAETLSYIVGTLDKLRSWMLLQKRLRKASQP